MEQRKRCRKIGANNEELQAMGTDTNLSLRKALYTQFEHATDLGPRARCNDITTGSTVPIRETPCPETPTPRTLP